MTTSVRPLAPAGARLLDASDLLGGRAEEDLAAWHRLAAGARHANPFSGPDLLLPALRHLTGGRRVALLLVTAPDGREVDLALPVVTAERIGRLPVRATAGWQHTHHFLGTPLVAPGSGPATWRTALDLLERASRDPWLVLPGIDAAVAADVEEAARLDGRASRRLRTEHRAVTHRRPQDDYVERQLSGRRRKELRRLRRRLDEAVGGGLELVDLVGEGRLEEGLDAFLRLEAAGWKGVDGGAIARDPAEEAFFREGCRALAARGALEVLALRGRTGDPVAMGLDLREGDTLFWFKTAYDETHAACSPGLLLHLDQLSRFHRSDAVRFDTCAVPGHPMADRLNPDHRELVTLAVALRRGPGDRAVRSAPPLLRAQDHARSLLRRARAAYDARTTDPREDQP